MARGPATAVGFYLVLGALFAMSSQPQQLWACPAPRAPHGEILHYTPRSPECEPTVTTGERVKHFAVLTLFGIPFAIVRGATGGG